jgi:hypothetical protein
MQLLWALWDAGEQRGVSTRREDAEHDLQVLLAEAREALGRRVAPASIGLEANPIHVHDRPQYLARASSGK